MNLRLLAHAAMAAMLCATAYSAVAETRYFAFTTYGPSHNPAHPYPKVPTYAPEEFVIEVSDPATIRHIEGILDNSYIGRSVHVKGLVAVGRADYNPHWSYHIVPGTVELFDNSAEECDATMFEVEENLDKVGEDFLPGNVWCPWSSKLVREVKYTPPQ